MISKERIDELEDYFWNESYDQGTQIWRNELNKEEIKLIAEWDKKVKKRYGYFM